MIELVAELHGKMSRHLGMEKMYDLDINVVVPPTHVHSEVVFTFHVDTETNRHIELGICIAGIKGPRRMHQ